MPSFSDADIGKVQPIVMIAHGTGIAPFISMLQRIQNDESVFQRVEVHFLFGARDNGEELLFGEFLTQFFEGNRKNKLYLACSREIEENKLKTLENVFFYKGYVQDMIKDDSFEAGKQIKKLY